MVAHFSAKTVIAASALANFGHGSTFKAGLRRLWDLVPAANGTTGRCPSYESMKGRFSTARLRMSVVPGGLAGLALSVVWASAVAAQEAGPAFGAASNRTADWLDSALHWTIRGIEIAGIGVIVIGAVAASVTYLHRAAREGPSEAQYHRFRSSLGRSILLGLEFLVAADIINTVAIDPTLESVAVLAGVVAVRTFLSFALEVEIDGKWPWRKGNG